MRPPLRRDPESTRKTVGIVLYVIGMLIGAVLLVVMFLLPPLFDKNPGFDYGVMLLGAVLALPMLVIYIWIPRIIDRFDPEPWSLLLLTLGWGAIAACGFSGLVNTLVDQIATAIAGDKQVGAAVGACFCAPIIEEGSKGLAVFGVYYFARRDFDGVVDGIIYATFVALGFAAVENVVYYSNAARMEILQHQEGALAGTFVLRGILAPWGHPLYTSMTGLGFGIARETQKTWLKWIAPLAGYCGAMFLHCLWNTAATISDMLMMVMLPLWLIFVFAFFTMVVLLVRRKGKIIRKFLEDEVLMGSITLQELDLVTSPFGSWKATFSWGGAAGRRFIDAAARLALSKWHSTRATKSRKRTISVDFIIPLRQELARHRWEVSRALGRQVPQPMPWQPGVPAPFDPRRR